jgi:Lrp/AsnC family transcriptional regulator for asnA, asnC and gidA
MQLDKTDWKIIHMLSEKHMSNTGIARGLGISEGTVRQRLKRLQSRGILKIKALRDPNLLQDQQLALVTVNVSEPRLLDIKAKEISSLDHVLSVSILSGQYDLIIEVLVDSNQGLIRFLTEELATVKGLRKTETFLLLRSYNKWI